VVIRSIDGSSISGTINSSGNAFTVAASGIAFEYR
jgi:hypothetical protein